MQRARELALCAGHQNSHALRLRADGDIAGDLRCPKYSRPHACQPGGDGRERKICSMSLSALEAPGNKGLKSAPKPAPLLAVYRLDPCTASS